MQSVKFKKLKLTGFKSFVDKTELEIEDGLTGIVGPNGCGKSNLVEALRWVMGESSAKKMRGSGMEDVIFAGTSNRAPRSFAEVSLTLDNSSKSAPASFNSYEEIEVARKIQRDQGSAYKINGRPARAHDVQVLFADVISGSNSPSMVSQGQITRVVSSKPVERRVFLEESAGIGGLYARRHEAEGRLKSADNNLTRLDDLTSSMNSRLSNLKRQAKQAEKYKTISAAIRDYEMLIAFVEWQAAKKRLDDGKRKFGEHDSEVAKMTAEVIKLTKDQSEISSKLPEIRETDAKISAKLQNLRITLHKAESEAKQHKALIEETTRQLTQAKSDIEHDRQSVEDLKSQISRIEKESETIASGKNDDDEKLTKLNSEKAELEVKIAELDLQYSSKMEELAEKKAELSQLTSTNAQDESRLKSFTAYIENAKKRLSEIGDGSDNNESIKASEENISLLEGEIEKLKNKIDGLYESQSTAESEFETNASRLSEAEKSKVTFTSEIATLEKFLEQEKREGIIPVIDQLQIETGFETALSKVLGEALNASENEEADMVWRNIQSVNETCGNLPKGCSQIIDFVSKYPDSMEVALKHIGVVDDTDTGDKLQSELLPGQFLVTKEGACWRWDGIHMKSSSVDRNAVILQQKNRLNELKAKLPDIDNNLNKIKKDHDILIERKKEISEQITAKRQAVQEAEKRINAQRKELDKLKHEKIKFENEISRIKENIQFNQDEADKLRAEISRNTDRIKEINSMNLTAEQERIDKIRFELQELREKLRYVSSASDLIIQKQDAGKARARAIADDRVNLNNRLIKANERIETLERRIKDLENKKRELDTKQASHDFASEDCQLNDQIQICLDKIAETEKERANSSEKLNSYERELSEINAELKKAEHSLSNAREARAAVQATVHELNQRYKELSSLIASKFGFDPVSMIGRLPEDKRNVSASDLPELRTKTDKLLRERDNIGPVNLQAAEEAKELEEELSGMLAEKEDLVMAISELRQGINKLNSEARSRISKTFDQVNHHFGILFTNLMGGGTAYIKMVDSDDPLEAGIEIFAQPPGKSLQKLTLLSGGEQTLTSIALIFAMFMTNPAPICVLDEIDAPLDDANVDRVCNLLEKMVKLSGTRFLIITHHRLTMARMNRLYGVTMAERGISQLVSVDMSNQFEFMDAA